MKYLHTFENHSKKFLQYTIDEDKFEELGYTKGGSTYSKTIPDFVTIYCSTFKKSIEVSQWNVYFIPNILLFFIKNKNNKELLKYGDTYLVGAINKNTGEITPIKSKEFFDREKYDYDNYDELVLPINKTEEVLVEIEKLIGNVDIETYLDNKELGLL